MINIWLVEIGRGMLWLFLQPLFYWALLLTIITSYYRRKNERHEFSSSVYSFGAEWGRTWLLSLLSGIIISAGLITIGGTMTYPVVLVLSILAILGSITGRLFFLSSGYFITGAIFIIWLLRQYPIEQIPSQWQVELNSISFPLLLSLAAVLLVIEALLWFTAKKEYAFPELIKGKRGKYIGLHVVKRLSVVPLLIPIPGGAIASLAPWWPVLPIGEQGYGFMLVPLLIGIQQSFQGLYSEHGSKLFGKWMLGLASVTALFAAGGFYDPIFVYIGAAVTLLGRVLIQLSIRFVDLEKPSIFRPQPDSLVILSVIQDSPADKMGLQAGEHVERVHQIQVSNEQEFYDALQESRTFCKLEVRNHEGELRFVQGPMFEGDHHELGLIFVKEKPRFRLYQDIPTSVVVQEEQQVN
ncbi:PDZ domain-containing protein [Salinibacillus xinjiangensis]|uniref:PDZ domain-containing protein n=1 Tax=Salinibacillus xinjiangensis TaxID=1229268 RepID=A0A6G1X1Q0_9BACI|nr:hypothetical protein [Salinibacillus xinjiangensis]MRG84758.1 hypothetical protein [Salinibacillus xinjiangensis]